MRLIDADSVFLSDYISKMKFETREDIREMIDKCPTVNALDKAVEYIESDAMGCPANYDRHLAKDKCLACAGELISASDKDYLRSISLKCWKEVFLNE